MAEILVTGASGFIGYHLLKALAKRGEEVACLVRKTSKVQQLEEFRPAWLYGDVTDPASVRAAVAGKSVVYHLAGCIKSLSAEQMRQVNADGVRNVARACAEQANPPVLVVVSSLAAAGPSTANRPRVESDSPAPVSVYGQTKRAGELAAQEFAGQTPITVLRPPIVFGEGDRVTAEMFRSIHRFRTHLVVSWRAHRFSLIHAEDLALAMIQAAERGQRLAPANGETEQPDSDGIYFIADPEQPTYGNLGRMVATSVGRRGVVVIPIALPVAWSVAGCSELVGRIRGQAPFLNFDKMREASAGSWTCSPQKAAEELGFTAAAPLAARLQQTADWYRKEGWL